MPEERSWASWMRFFRRSSSWIRRQAGRFFQGVVYRGRIRRARGQDERLCDATSLRGPGETSFAPIDLLKLKRDAALRRISFSSSRILTSRRSLKQLGAFGAGQTLTKPFICFCLAHPSAKRAN